MSVTKRRSNSKKNLKSKKSKNSKSRVQHKTRKSKFQVGGYLTQKQRDFLSAHGKPETEEAWSTLPYDLEKKFLKEQGITNNNTSSSYTQILTPYNNSSGYNSSGYNSSDSGSSASSSATKTTNPSTYTLREEDKHLTPDKALWLGNILYGNNKSDDEKKKRIYDMYKYKQHELYNYYYSKYGSSSDPYLTKKANNNREKLENNRRIEEEKQWRKERNALQKKEANAKAERMKKFMSGRF